MADPQAPVAPAYGRGTLSDLLPSVLAGLGVPGEADVLGVGELRRAVVLLVDGMGEQLLRRSAGQAPFLSALSGRTLQAGFPTTTVASLSSLGTGLPPGEHGLTGYVSYVEELGGATSWLGWRPAEGQPAPEQLQPRATAFERAAAAGVTVTQAAPAVYKRSGFTRAVLRGGRYAGAVTAADTVALAAEAARQGERSLVYCYTPDLDLTGHVRGCGSEAWATALRLVDALAEQLAARLPRDAVLFVTADHGMVDVPDEDRVDLDELPALTEDVLAVAGEPRVRHLHVRPGAARDVRAAWQEVLGDRMWVGSREQALAAGLLGPVVTAEARARTGDVVAVATSGVAVVQSRSDPMMAGLRGHHGALTPDELLVPLLRSG